MPAAVTLVVSLFLLEWSSAAFGEHIVDSLDTIHKCLACKLRVMLDDTLPVEVSRAENLDEELVRRSVALGSVYEQAAFEIRLGRLNGRVAFHGNFINGCSQRIHSSHIAQAIYRHGRTSAPRTRVGDVNAQGLLVSGTSRDF